MSDHEGCRGIFMASSSEAAVSSPVSLPVTGQSSQRSLRDRADRKPDQDIACPMRKQNNPRRDQTCANKPNDVPFLSGHCEAADANAPICTARGRRFVAELDLGRGCKATRLRPSP